MNDVPSAKHECSLCGYKGGSMQNHVFPGMAALASNLGIQYAMSTRSRFPPHEWQAFAWMLTMGDMLRRCRPALFRFEAGAKEHEQDKPDARALQAEIRAMFPHAWEANTAKEAK